MTGRLLPFCFLMVVATPASADSWANGVSVYSDRVRRGVSQTDGIGIAGEIKYNSDAGWYAGLWAGNVGYANVTGETIELLPFAAYGRRIGSVRAELGVLHHSYIGADRKIDYDELEVTFSRKLGPASLVVGGYYRLRNEAGGHSRYLSTDLRAPLATVARAKVALNVHAGLNRDPSNSRNDFEDQSIGLFATRGNSILGIGASRNNLSPVSVTPGAPAAGTRAYISFTQMFRKAH